MRSILVVLLAVALLGAFPAGPASAIDLGAEAPEITVDDVVTADPIVLSDYRGKVVVLVFFAWW